MRSFAGHCFLTGRKGNWLSLPTNTATNLSCRLRLHTGKLGQFDRMSNCIGSKNFSGSELLSEEADCSDTGRIPFDATRSDRADYSDGNRLDPLGKCALHSAIQLSRREIFPGTEIRGVHIRCQYKRKRPRSVHLY
jgi:hypothetical protein